MCLKKRHFNCVLLIFYVKAQRLSSKFFLGYYKELKTVGYVARVKKFNTFFTDANYLASSTTTMPSFSIL